MKVQRSASQIYFHHLPEQTVDAGGGIWKVHHWIDPKVESSVDQSVLRDELIRAAYPWKTNNEDGGFVDDLYRQNVVKVLSVNRQEGVWCEQYPELYLCNNCMRIHDKQSGKCECGSTRKRGQFPFIGYHSECGSIKAPYVKKCDEHGQCAVRLPGSAKLDEITFHCPVCNRHLQKNFGSQCHCGKGTNKLTYSVHRSGQVFRAHQIRIINPPRRDVLSTIENAGGGERALEWILEGMAGTLMEAAPSKSLDTLKKVLSDRGFDHATIEAMVAAIPQSKPNESTQSEKFDIHPAIRADAERHAKQIALAVFEGRTTLSSQLSRTTSQALQSLYGHDYPIALNRAGIECVELVDQFPILTAQFGYTRGGGEPGAARLRTYRNNNGEYQIYGEIAKTEALFIRLNPVMVHKWLVKNGENLAKGVDKRTAAIAILAAMEPDNESYQKVVTLVHSFAHAFIKRTAVYAGIDRNALSELIFPTSLSFFVYAAARGNFVLGGLQALFESDLDKLLSAIVDDEYRCALDPGCEEHGSACAICIHLGEPSCQLYNTKLSRNVLSGGMGYFDVTTSDGST